MGKNVIDRSAPFRYVLCPTREPKTNFLQKPFYDLKRDGIKKFSCYLHPGDDYAVGYDWTHPVVYSSLKPYVQIDEQGQLILRTKHLQENVYEQIPQWVKDEREKLGSAKMISQKAGAITSDFMLMPPFTVYAVFDLTYALSVIKSIWLTNQVGVMKTIEVDGFECEKKEGLWFALHQGGVNYSNRWMDNSPMGLIRPSGLTSLIVVVKKNGVDWYLNGRNIKSREFDSFGFYNLHISSIPVSHLAPDSEFIIKFLQIYTP